MKSSDIVASLRSVQARVRNDFKATIKGIFGSYARGDHDDQSDIDVIVEFQPGATLLDLTRLGDFLENMLQKKVDLVSERAVRQELREHIYEELMVV